MGNRMRNQVSPAHRVRTARLVLGVLVLLAARQVTAEPYLMVREGAKCSACHINQSGGGKLTAFAHIHAKDILHDLDLLPIPAGVKAFNGDLSQYVSIGADFRVRNTTIFNDRRGRAGTVPQDRAFRRKVISNDPAMREALIYAQVDLWPLLATLTSRSA